MDAAPQQPGMAPHRRRATPAAPTPSLQNDAREHPVATPKEAHRSLSRATGKRQRRQKTYNHRKSGDCESRRSFCIMLIDR